ncbi:hypothetical protein ACI2OX_08400 [Bacillus sp. N9]
MVAIAEAEKAETDEEKKKISLICVILSLRTWMRFVITVKS